jgi:CHAT domain-containing protein/tetratricopeptide (TPR) repeat protein
MLLGQGSEKAATLKEQALNSDNLAACQQLFKDASNIYAEAKDWKNYFDAATQITEILIQEQVFDEAIAETKAYLTNASNSDYKGIELSLLHKNLGKAYYQLDDYYNAIAPLETALTIRKSLNSNDPELARDYGNLGIISRFSGRYNKAIKYLEAAINLQQDKDVLARLYNEIGINYKLIGNFRKSLDYQNQAITLLEKSTNKTAFANALAEKGTTLTILKQEKIDRLLINMALDIFSSDATLDYINQLQCHTQLAASFMQFFYISNSEKSGLDSALVHYQKALTIAQNNLPKDNPYTPSILFDIGNVLSQLGKIKEAQNYIKQGDLLFKELQVVGLEEQFPALGIKADFEAKQGNYQKALQYIQKQLELVLPDWKASSIYDSPTIADIKDNLSEDLLTDALALKSRVLYNYYKNDNSKKSALNAALKSIELFDEAINLVRSNFANSGSNIAWSDITLDAYENAIEICLALSLSTNDNTFKEQAFYYSEKSKGLSLLEAFQNTKAKKIEGINLEKELTLKLDIADLDQKLFQLKQEIKEDQQAAIKILEKKLFEKKEQYHKMIKTFEKKHPKYFNTKYKLDIMDSKQVQKMLASNQAMIEYFVGDSTVYAFKITKNSFDLFALDIKTALNLDVLELRESIYGYFFNSKKQNNQLLEEYTASYNKKAHYLYQSLIAPLGELPKRLIIIPDGALCNIPFESLLEKQVDQTTQFSAYPFLVRKHIISYTYSSTLLREMKETQHEKAKHTYLGFAPSFSKGSSSLIRGKRYHLAPLKYNFQEVDYIHSMLRGGTIFKGAAATEEQFKKLASEYSIIHFATHGLANSKDPDYSLLAFSEIKDDIENEFLYVSDLYNLELKADLVVLSACETAIGKNFRGEGVISLARGFSYAGAKSIFTTLWSVNDEAAFKVVANFYANMQEGMDKAEALQVAKVYFINSDNNIIAHPFFWSPFILIGDTSALPRIQKSYSWLLLIGGVGISIAFLGLAYWIKNRRKHI